MADAIGLTSVIQTKFDLDLGEIVDDTTDPLPILQAHTLTSSAKYVYKTYTFSKPVLSAATIGSTGSLAIPIGEVWVRVDVLGFSGTNASGSSTSSNVSVYAKLTEYVLTFAMDLFLSNIKTVTSIITGSELDALICVFYNTNDVAVS